MWEEIMILMYRLWLHSLHGLYGPQCPMVPEMPLNLITQSLVICEKIAEMLGLGPLFTQLLRWAPNGLPQTWQLYNFSVMLKTSDENKHCIPTDKQHGSQPSAPNLLEWCRDWLLHHSNVCTHTPYTKTSAYLASAYEVYLVTLRPRPLWGPVSSSKGL